MNELFNIRNNFESYQKLINFHQQNKDTFFDTIQVSLSSWFEANLSTVLGALLDLLINQVNNIRFDHIDEPIEIILKKNDFLSYYGKERISDTKHTTIKYQKLKPSDGKYFKSYLVGELLGRNELPLMSKQAKEKIGEAIYEIFANAQIHSKTDFIYTCGQFYPTKNMIEFTIVDTGIGFKQNINNRFHVNLSDTQAIRWALKDRHTTKENISGGIGLSILREFIGMNKGLMQIVSDKGFYELNGDNGRESFQEFEGSFPGSIVNLMFKTDDPNNYSLKSEIDINNIF